MSYHIYSTDGIILKRTAFGEANALVHILTSDLGLIIASAQSARLSTSKLSSALTEYSLVSLSVIKAKRGWKVTDARAKENFYFDSHIFSKNMLARISAFLLQMMPGEEPHKEIFEIIYSGFYFLRTLSESDVQNFETVIVLRVLHHLGYVAKNVDTESFMADTTTWNETLLTDAFKNRTRLVGVINKGIQESHL